MTRPSCKVTVPEVRPLVSELYDRHLAGCCLHIVLDDGNIDDSDIKFCVDYARKAMESEPRKGHEKCLVLAEKLLLMSRSQRHRIYRRM